MSGSDIPLFFIIGRPRSGTTLLRMLLDAHPHVLIPPESPLILNLYKKYNPVKKWDEKILLQLYRDIIKQRYFDIWLVDKEKLKETLLSFQGENSFHSIVKAVYLLYHSVYPKQKIELLGDKNPGYSLYIKRIFKLFPDSKFIYIARDYRDNYLSLINVNFEIPVVPLVVYRWKFAYKQFRKLCRENPDKFYYLKYEDLVTHPEKEYQKICKFLEIEFRKDVFEFHTRKEKIEKLYQDSEELRKIHRSLLNPITSAKIDTWKTKMTNSQVKKADYVAGTIAEEAGYSRKYTRFGLWLKIKLFPILFYGSTIYRIMLMGERLPIYFRNALLGFLGIFLKIYRILNRKKFRS